MFARLLIVLSTLSVACGRLYTDDAVQQKQLWDSFKAEFAKSYDTMEIESRRFYHFLENLKVADARNVEETKLGGSAIHGITRFSDMSQSEFEAGMLTSDVSMKTDTAEVVTIDTPPLTTTGLVDWSGKYTTAVKDQGYCGSCWAFSATEQIESDAIRTLGFSTSQLLSPQQITSCDTRSSGCNGGWTERAYDYVKQAGGLETNSDYPYTSYQGTTGTCKANSAKYVVKVNSYSTIRGESSMASYVQSKGPLSVCIDASTWNSYRGGIVSSCGKRVNHCVQAVGVDASSSGYWKVRNSWGTSWGESGYIRLAYGKDMCAITNDPTYVSVSKK